MNIRFDGKAVLITGASTGIGATAAVQFAQAGARIGIGYFHSKPQAAEVLAKVRAAGSDGILLGGDVGEPDQVRKIVADFAAYAGRIDVLVNNAGALIERRPIEQMDPALLRKVFALNVDSVVFATQAATPWLRKSKGNIVNLGSIAGYTGGGGGACHYAAAKGAVHTLTVGLAKELAPDIRVNCVAPGVIETPFHERMSTPQFMAAMAAAAPLKRNGLPDEVAAAILFLASEAASLITGQSLSPNGGVVLRP